MVTSERGVLSARLKQPSLTESMSRAFHFVAGYFDRHIHDQFVDDMFASREAYEMYVQEFERSRFDRIRDRAIEQFHRSTDIDGLGDVGVDVARDFYAIVREHEPERIVETGVCNGVSTLAILIALDKNGHGSCHSIDFPRRADVPLAEFRQQTFEGYGGAAIPSDKDPGWIIPDEFRDRWTLRIGKSQTELPELRTELGAIDLFIHDSEHSAPCMAFEFELAWEWLRSDGILLADDITWTDAFDEFAAARDARVGRLKRSVGYFRDPGA